PLFVIRESRVIPSLPPLRDGASYRAATVRERGRPTAPSRSRLGPGGLLTHSRIFSFGVRPRFGHIPCERSSAPRQTGGGRASNMTGTPDPQLLDRPAREGFLRAEGTGFAIPGPAVCARLAVSLSPPSSGAPPARRRGCRYADGCIRMSLGW